MGVKLGKGQLVLMCLNVFLIMILAFAKVDFTLALVVELFVCLAIVCFENIYSHFYFFLFLTSFFIFLVSGDLADALFGRKYWQQFSEEANAHSHLSILISLIGMMAGYVLWKTENVREKVFSLTRKVAGRDLSEPKYSLRQGPVHTKEYYEQIRSVSKWVYFCFYLILMLDTLNKVYYVRVNGYVSYYTGYRSFLGPLAQLGDFAPIALCAFLATFPSKKEAAGPLWLYFIYAACGFLIGQRGALIYNMAFLVGYLFYRNRHDENGEVWIRRWWIVAACLAAPFAVIALQIYGFIRNGEEIQFTSLSQTFVDFFVGIGSSSKVIKAGYDYRDQLTEFKFYSLGDTINYFKYSRLFNWFGTIPAGHTAEYATQGHSFGEMISYVYMKTKYLNGEGAGSSFIACLYTDFGYIGVAIGSFLYGILFKSISVMKREKWLLSTIQLYALMFLMKAPRGSYDCFVGGIVNVTFICVLIMIYLLATRVHFARPLRKVQKKAG